MDYNREIITKSAEETKKIGKILSDAIVKKHTKGELVGPIVICLYGELGSGKTTFTQGVLQVLTVEKRFLSPTFIIVRRYESPVLGRTVSHIDCYRLTDSVEMGKMGFQDEFVDPTGFVIIEWADRLGKILPEHRMDIFFDVRDTGHMIKITNDPYGFTG